MQYLSFLYPWLPTIVTPVNLTDFGKIRTPVARSVFELQQRAPPYPMQNFKLYKTWEELKLLFSTRPIKCEKVQKSALFWVVKGGSLPRDYFCPQIFSEVTLRQRDGVPTPGGRAIDPTFFSVTPYGRLQAFSLTCQKVYIGVVIFGCKLLHTWRVRSRGCGVERVVPDARFEKLSNELGFVQIRPEMAEL